MHTPWWRKLSEGALQRLHELQDLLVNGEEFTGKQCDMMDEIIEVFH